MTLAFTACPWRYGLGYARAKSFFVLWYEPSYGSTIPAETIRTYLRIALRAKIKLPPVWQIPLLLPLPQGGGAENGKGPVDLFPAEREVQDFGAPRRE